MDMNGKSGMDSKGGAPQATGPSGPKMNPKAEECMGSCETMRKEMMKEKAATS